MDIDELSSNICGLVNWSIDDCNELYETIMINMEEFVHANPYAISRPSFEDDIYNYTKHVFDEQFINNNVNIICTLEQQDEITQMFNILYKMCSGIFYQIVIPRRSFKTSFVRHHIQNNINNAQLKSKIEHIDNKPQPEQRTPEWYSYRHNLITASNAWKCFESEKTKNNVIYEKCKPIDASKSQMTSRALVWGQKYEHLTTMLYEHHNQTNVTDYGCIQHDTYKFLGASPDGIVTDEKASVFGRMLEIKNVVSRIINGIPKKEYWIQMQLQMEVCNLNECDFIETKFTEYDDEDIFKSDGGFAHEDNIDTAVRPNYKDYIGIRGAIVEFVVDGKSEYKFAPLFISSDEFEVLRDKWIDDMLKNDHVYLKTTYWKMEDISCILVLRNKRWFKSTIHDISKVWDIILMERISGYEHRAPNKRVTVDKMAKTLPNYFEFTNSINKVENPNEQCLLGADTNIAESLDIKDDNNNNTSDVKIETSIRTESFDDTYVHIDYVS